MDATISQRELRNDSGTIMRRVEHGESFTITRNGSPVADLVPHDPGGDGRRRFVPVDVIARTIDTLPDWNAVAFADELSELDAVVDDADSDPWTL